MEACELRRFGGFNLAALRMEGWFKDMLCERLAGDHYALYRQLDASSSTERVALALAAFCAGTATGAGGTLRVELNQGDLAESVGMTRETVNRCLKRLEAAGLLETERGSVLVYDLAALRDWED
jgi:CRP-like cAMP-binding protein